MMSARFQQGGGASVLPLSLIAQAIPMLSRHELESVTERLIERLDSLDGDAEAEEDDPAGQCDEDGVNTGHGNFVPHGSTFFAGAGCPINGDQEPDRAPGEQFG